MPTCSWFLATARTIAAADVDQLDGGVEEKG